MVPVNSNTQSKTCPDPISSNCVIYGGPDIPGLNICRPTSITQLITDIGTRVIDLQTDISTDGIDFSCLYSPVINVWTCPSGWNFIADATAPNRAGYCSNGCPPGSRPVGSGGACVNCFPVACPSPAPTLTTSPNPVPPPSTIKDLMILLIARVCQCDPCLLNSTASAL